MRDLNCLLGFDGSMTRFPFVNRSMDFYGHTLYRPFIFFFWEAELKRMGKRGSVFFFGYTVALGF